MAQTQTRDEQIISVYYSHLSRLFVSSYQTAFVTYLAFLAFCYASLLRRDPSDKTSPLFYVVTAFVMLAIFVEFCRRARQFGRRLDTIETQHFTLVKGVNVRTRFWGGPPCVSNDIKFWVAVILAVISFLISIRIIYGPI